MISFLNKNGKFLDDTTMIKLVYEHLHLDLVQMFGSDEQKVEYYN